MDQRIKLIGDWLQGSYSKSELARHYGLSRPTLDKWLARYEARGIDGLKELSRRPHTSPLKISDKVLELLIAYKREHHSWGPEKIVHNLRIDHPELSWPPQWVHRVVHLDEALPRQSP